MKENERRVYFNMILGSIGLLLIAVVAMKHLIEEIYSNSYPIIFFGFILTMNYINFLEERVGISKKFTYIRGAISIFLLFGITYLLYF